ncbi:alpha/beta fold hydrolase [uncultured Amnibacterium sp.]|uniref:alpha/beta fold hydrolase n=1 Tax=uncultured Amnibacterium sp. TaxID=1631851 RepID=UPI0035CBBBD4
MKVVASPYAALLDRTPMVARTAQVEGTPAAYWEYGRAGDGPTLLFVHGFRGDHHGLEPVIAYLPGVHILAPDLPGFGLSAALPGEHSIDAYAAWVRAFGVAVGLDEHAILLGHSFGSIVVGAALAGGMPAAAAIFVNPIAAPALAGPNAVGTRLASLYYRVGEALPERAGGALLKSPLVVRGSSMFLAKTREKPLRAWIHNQHARYFSAYASRRVVLESFRASVEHDLTEYVGALRVPVHLVAAEHDDITALSDVQALADRIPGATLTVIPKVGHLIHYETPRPAAERIAEVAGVAPVG